MHPINISTTETNKEVVQRLSKELLISEENIFPQCAILHFC